MSAERIPLLFVEDEETFRTFTSRYLEEHGYAVAQAGTGAEAFEKFEAAAPELVILDLNLPDMHGLDILRKLRQRSPQLPVVVLTSFGDAPTAISALKAGAADYLIKPLRVDHLLQALGDALEATRPHKTAARRSGTEASALEGHPLWLRAVRRLDRVAASEMPGLLLLGESGTGKSMLARRFHEKSGRASGPFVEINCPSIPEALLESELFGHEKGAFTGADTRKPGQFELADKGTLFLDEIGELPLELQPKLLRFLEQHRFRRVGGVKELQSDIRLVCATNRDLLRDVEAGIFRSDLYYRLEIISLVLPSLRERGDDTVLLARTLVQTFARELGVDAPTLTPEAEAALLAYPFPGNVRELRNVIRRAVAFAESARIDVADLDLRRGRRPSGKAQRPVTAISTARSPEPELTLPLEQVLQCFEAEFVERAIQRTRSQREAGAQLGLDRFAVARRLKNTRRLGGTAAANSRLAEQPEWATALIQALRGAEGEIDLAALRDELESKLVAQALELCGGNRAKAAPLLGVSPSTLTRRLAEDRLAPPGNQ